MRSPVLHRPCLLVAILVCLLVLSGMAACSGPSAGGSYGPVDVVRAEDRPRLRSGGPRIPPYSGTDPASSGWERRGGVWIGPAGSGILRTKHVEIRSGALPDVSVEIARRAQAHVELLVATYGDALDLRLPIEPLPVFVHATRASFSQALARLGPSHPGWGAFYDSLRGTVHVSVEPAPQGGLPLVADLRHEMTHQLLDLSTPPIERYRIFRGEGLWLWEGFAAFCETLGDGPGEDTGRLRRERFVLRRDRGEAAPLTVLFHLDQTSFQGRHYDQCAVFTGWLMKDGMPGARAATLGALAEILRGRMSANGVERRLGQDAASIERTWRSTW